MLSMNDNTNKISNILQQVRLLKRKYDKLAAVTGEQFNVFSILGVEADEVRTHSAFLADLLDPHGSHRQEDAFQKLFLKVALNHSGPDEYGDFEPFQVRKEASTDQGQIDILLENKEACIVIENKIYAGDQDRQMERYYQYATSKGFSKEKEQIKLVYLTLDGSPPSTESLGNLPEHSVKCLSYSEDIINWLEECMKLQEVQRIAPIREIVFQYRDLLKELTGQSTNTRYSMELTELLIKDKNYELIPHLEQALLELKVQTQLKFWQELANIMPKKVDQSGIHDDQEKEASEGNIRHFYTGSRDRLWYGTTFKLASFSWKQTEIALRVELGGGGWVFYGFILFEDGKRVKSCDNKKFNSHAEKLPDYDFTRNNWWIGWKWPKKDLGFPVEYLGAEAETLLFLLDDKRRKAVGQLATEIATTVAQLKKNLN